MLFVVTSFAMHLWKHFYSGRLFGKPNAANAAQWVLLNGILDRFFVKIRIQQIDVVVFNPKGRDNEENERVCQ